MKNILNLLHETSSFTRIDFSMRNRRKFFKLSRKKIHDELWAIYFLNTV